MTEETFAEIPIEGKWAHLKKTMDYIVNMDRQYTSTNTIFDLRRRFNPHHTDEMVNEEKERLKEQQRNLRVDQYQRWSHVKNLYAAHRDELANTLGNVEYEECKSIIERIFTAELDDALRNVLDD